MLRLTVATVAAAILTGLGAVGFYFASVGMIGALLGWAGTLRFLVPVAGFFLVGVILQLFPATRVGGIRDVRASLLKDKEPVPLVRAVNVALSCIILGFGGSAGSEGPIAQFGGLVGSRVGQLFRLHGIEIQTVMRAAIAAGTAALFRS